MTKNNINWIEKFDEKFYVNKSPDSREFWSRDDEDRPYEPEPSDIKAFIQSTLQKYADAVEKIVVSTGDEVLSPTNSSDMAIEQITIKQFKKFHKLNTTYGLKIEK